MALTVPTIAAGDTKVATLNADFDLVEAAVNTLDGAALVAASVPVSKLAKPKAIHQVVLCTDRALATTTIAGLWSFKLPNIDGASNSTWKYIGASAAFQTVTTALGAGAVFDLLKNGASIHQVPIDSTKISAAATPYQENLGTANAGASSDIYKVNFTAGATGSVQYTTLVLTFSLEHVGT